MANKEIHELLEKIAAFAKGNPEAEEKVEQLRERLSESGVQTLEDAQHMLGELGLGNILGSVVSFGGSVRTLDVPSEDKSSFGAKLYGKRGVKTVERPVAEEEKEPALDVFEEDSCITVMGDMPGVTQENIRWNIEGTTLTIWTEEGRKYRTTLDLPSPVSPNDVAISYRNGVIIMTLKRST